MPKQTAKFVAAIRALNDIEGRGGAPVRDAEALYKWLAERQYAWNNRSGTWSKVARPVSESGRESTSLFTDPEGNPTRVFRVRIMANPEIVERIAAHMATLYEVLEPPSEQYENRKGPGSRVYVTLIFRGAMPKRELRGRAHRTIDTDEEES